MKKGITRRDFLKLSGLLPLSVAAPRFINSLDTLQQAENKPPNVIVVVFDALSAFDVSLYGYQRETTPNIARWAERAVVYHNHHAGGNFTIPGTASLLTGTFPWTHRAFSLNQKNVEKSFLDKNIFSTFPNHYRIAYTHNPVANGFLTQFSASMDEYVPLGKLFLASDDFISSLFEKDEDTANVSWIRAMKKKEEGYAYSLFLARLYEKQRERLITGLQSQFPGGIPHVAEDDYFLLEDAIDWLGETLGNLPQPFMGYFHFMPPHFPYLTHKDFQGRFEGDDFLPEFKPSDAFSSGETNKFEFLLRKRTNYDEYILYADREFGRLMDQLELSGILDKAWVILTSDHGEMFERGILGHTTPVLYQPVIKVPLLIFEPGQKSRRDIYANTSAVDLLPTLLHVTDQRLADWIEGFVLPPFQPTKFDSERSLYAVQARTNAQYEPLTIATTALIKGQYKLMYFFGYDELGGAGSERIEMYDLENDPEELNDLSSAKRETTVELLNELKQKITEVDKPYL
ncbi:MAG: sulfatase-like hydrolase/transferase [Anaerolineales bacterium]